MLTKKIKVIIVRIYNHLVCLLPIRLANIFLIVARDMNWSISIYEGEDFLNLRPTSIVQNPILSRKDVTDTIAGFVADPFVIQTPDEWLLFFEVFNHKRYRGEIAFARSVDGYRWNYQHIILSEKFHLSYPYVFKYESDWYMIPESCQANSIRLYQAKKFPDTWEFVKEILVGSRFVDASILNFNGLWWLFVGIESADGLISGDTLNLYYADSPLSDWVEHPMSPLVSGNMAISRPAGRMRQIDNHPIRFTQDCKVAYGYNVRAIKIDTLTKTEYAEVALKSDDAYLFELGTMPCNNLAIHHLDFIMLNDESCLAYVDSQ